MSENTTTMQSDDVLEAAVEELMETSSESEDDEILELIERDSDNEDDVLEAVIEELMETSSESEDDEILELIERDSDNEEQIMLNMFQYFPGQKRNSIKNYLDEVAATYTEEEFRQHFRISKDLFISLSDRFAESEMYRNLRPDKRLPAKTHLAVFLWFAGHEACSFSDLSDRFNLSRSTVSRTIHKTIMFISSLSPEVIKWPSEIKKQESANSFKAKCGFAKVIGCIDGTHIVIDPPAKCKDDYIDRKGNTTLTMQAVCDERKKFINIFVGYPGSSHDSWVFRNSPLYQNLATSCRDYYLLGDSAYPCSQYLVTPYKDNGHLTREQKNFNIKLSSGRVCIEHCFGMVKQRFRQLYYCKLRGINKLCHFIRACCVLHNIANDDDLLFSEVDEDEEVLDNELPAQVLSGNAIRDSICKELHTNTE